jgi:hypothetical protein
MGDAPLTQVKVPRPQPKEDEERLEDRKGVAG